MAETKGSEDCRISKLGTTDDTLTSRGGLAFFVKYIEAVGILGLLLAKFEGIKKSAKGVTIGNLFLQALYFFFDGTSRHVSYFDQLKKDTGYAAVVEMPDKQVASSHAVKRFFGAFGIFRASAFRWVLRELFVWRLRLNEPVVVTLTLDTMVMDNDEALKREGCDPTYKKVKGFQPLQLIWEGKIVDAIFRRGKRHSNYGNDVEKMIRGIVTLIRTRYNARADIVIRMDAGFFDEQNFRLCDLCLANSQFWRKRAERNRIAVNRPKSAAGAVTNIRWKCSIRSKLPEFKVVQKRVCTKVTPRLAFDIAHGSAAAIDTN